jgi:predicted RNA-binding protein with PIN domain
MPDPATPFQDTPGSDPGLSLSVGLQLLDGAAQNLGVGARLLGCPGAERGFGQPLAFPRETKGAARVEDGILAVRGLALVPAEDFGEHGPELVGRDRCEDICGRGPEERHPVGRKDGSVDREPVSLPGLRLAVGAEESPGSCVEVQLEGGISGRLARRLLCVDDELEPARRARKRLMAQGGNERDGRLVGERPVNDNCHIEVAAPRLIAAERPRPAGVDTHERSAEHAPDALDELVQIRVFPLHKGILSVMLYLFDGYNILHAGSFREREELIDRLASFVALRGARGVVVFDGAGEDTTYGDLSVCFAPDADALIERLAAEHREREEVWVVSSDRAIRGTAGQETRRVSSKTFLRDLDDRRPKATETGTKVEETLDENTRSALERFRRRRH